MRLTKYRFGVKMIRACISILILVFVMSTPYSCYSKDSFDEEYVYTAEGKISAIDTFRSTINVKVLTLQPVLRHNDITLFIGPNTKMMYKGSAISIFDFTMGSPVNITYVNKGDTLEALQIMVTK